MAEIKINWKDTVLTVEVSEDYANFVSAMILKDRKEELTKGDISK